MVFNGSKLIYFILFLVAVYSNSTQDVVNPLLYQGFIEETVELLELDQPQFSVSLLTQLVPLPSCLQFNISDKSTLQTNLYMYVNVFLFEQLVLR